jgi:hypothetical protein
MENENDRISGEQGSIKPEETLTDILRTVAYNREDADQAPMRAAANGALIRWLKETEASDIEADQRVLQFALEKHGFDSVNEFVDAFFGAGEPVMAAARKDLADLDPEELELGSEATFELQNPEEGDGA